MCEHERNRQTAVFTRLLALAEDIGAVKTAQLYGSFAAVEGKTERGRFFLSLTLEEEHG